MSHLFAVLQTEMMKVRKSKVIWLAAAAFTIAPLMAGFFMFVLKNPELAESSGLLGAKAQIAGEADWPSYLELYGLMIAVGGLLVFGFVTSWIFGSEFTDGTAKDLWALPYSRAVIVIAKFIASTITHFVLSGYIVALGFIIGWVIGLPEWSAPVIAHGLYILAGVTILTVLLSIPVAFFACYGGGYLAPLGFVVFTLVLSQIIAATGYGPYFPWSIPALFGGITGEEMTMGLASLLIILTTSLVGFGSTLYWWLFADHH